MTRQDDDAVRRAAWSARRTSLAQNWPTEHVVSLKGRTRVSELGGCGHHAAAASHSVSAGGRPVLRGAAAHSAGVHGRARGVVEIERRIDGAEVHWYRSGRGGDNG